MEALIISIKQLVSEEHCYAAIRQLCWPDKFAALIAIANISSTAAEHLRNGIDKKSPANAV